MSGMLGFIAMLSVIFLGSLYFIIRYAVEDGTLNALMKYESMKNQQNNSEGSKS